MFGRLRATFPRKGKSSTDTIRAFKTNKSNIWAYGYFMLFFIPGIVLRGIFTYETPDVIYAPVIKSWKYSTEAVQPLQNDKFNFVKCNMSEVQCFQPTSPEEINHNHSHIPAYYKDLYKIDGEQMYQLMPFHTVKTPFFRTHRDFVYRYQTKFS